MPEVWIEEQDVENLSFEKATWIPLVVEETKLLQVGMEMSNTVKTI